MTPKLPFASFGFREVQQASRASAVRRVENILHLCAADEAGMQTQSLAQVCRCFGTFSRGLLDPVELPNVRAAVFVAALNDEYVAIQFERPRLIRPCVAWLETAFHDMRDDAVGLVDAIGPKVCCVAVVSRTHLGVSPLIVIAGSKRWSGRHSHDLDAEMTGGVIAM